MVMSSKEPISLTYNPQLSSREYGVNLYIDEGNNDPQRVQFNAIVQYCGEFESNYSIFHLFKHNLVLNRNLADEHAIQLAVECNKAFYPLTLLTDKRGLIYTLRTDNILARWKEQRVKIERYFKGEEARKYIEATESALMNKEKVNMIVLGDLFFSQFFELNYRSDTINFKRLIHLAPFADPQEFDCQQSVDKESLKDKDSDVFVILQLGSMSKEYTPGELFPRRLFDPQANEKIVEGRYEVTYELQKETNVIDSMTGYFILHQGDHKLFEIKLEAYHLSEKTIQPEKDTELLKLVKNKNKQNKSLIGRALAYLLD